MILSQKIIVFLTLPSYMLNRVFDSLKELQYLVMRDRNCVGTQEGRAQLGAPWDWTERGRQNPKVAPKTPTPRSTHPV